MQVPPAPPADSIRAVLRSIFAGPAYQWTVRRTPWDVVRDAWNAVQSFLDGLARLHPIAFFALMIVLTLFILLMFTHFAMVLARAVRRAAPEAAGVLAPMPVAHDRAWHHARAQQLAAAGRYAEALGHRFTVLLLDLERRRAVTVRASRTPAEYAREVRLDGDGRAGFAALVATLYAALFGGDRVDAAAFAAFDRDASELLQRAPTH